MCTIFSGYLIISCFQFMNILIFLTYNFLLQLFSYCAAATAKSLQSCPTLCDPIDGSPPGSPIPGILQARTLEWVALSFSMCVQFFQVIWFFLVFSLWIFWLFWLPISSCSYFPIAQHTTLWWVHCQLRLYFLPVEISFAWHVEEF